MPPNLSRLQSDHGYYVAENILALRNTRIGNLLGLCGISLPTGTPSCGLMLLGQPFEEEKLLRVASAVESSLR
jgi:aspartyl-tRNA(Asn)/glutamyl-tRNA(Gln) amidotransferase subunit A